MAALPPPRARARHLLLATLAAAAVGAGIGYLVHIWPAPEPLRDPFPHASQQDVALYAVDEGTHIPGADTRCLLFLDEWMRLPNWSVTITRVRQDPSAPLPTPATTTVVTISEAGQAVFTARPHEPRAVFLSPQMLARLHGIAEESCASDPRSHAPTGQATVRWGATEDTPGPTVYRGSVAYALLERFVDDVSLVTDPPPTPLRLD